MINLTITNILGQPNGIVDLKKGFDKTLKKIPAASKDFLRISRNCKKIALIISAIILD